MVSDAHNVLYMCVSDTHQNTVKIKIHVQYSWWEIVYMYIHSMQLNLSICCERLEVVQYFVLIKSFI